MAIADQNNLNELGMIESKLTCPDCGAPMQLRQSAKYPYKDGSPRKFYGCSRFPICKAAHGAHPDGRPLGVPANSETKAARIKAHDAFDALWRDKQLMSRYAAYDWLSTKLGHEAHMGEMGIDECNQVIALCEAFDINDPDAVTAIANGRRGAKRQKAKWKKQRANWSRKKKTEYNREKRKRQKANRAARKASQSSGINPAEVKHGRE